MPENAESGCLIFVYFLKNYKLKVRIPWIVKSRSGESRVRSEEFPPHSSNLFIVGDKWILELLSVVIYLKQRNVTSDRARRCLLETSLWSRSSPSLCEPRGKVEAHFKTGYNILYSGSLTFVPPLPLTRQDCDLKTSPLYCTK